MYDTARFIGQSIVGETIVAMKKANSSFEAENGLGFNGNIEIGHSP